MACFLSPRSRTLEEWCFRTDVEGVTDLWTEALLQRSGVCNGYAPRPGRWVSSLIHYLLPS